MLRKPDGSFSWDIRELSKALKIAEQDVRPYFTDGRRASFILERRLEKEFFRGSRPHSEGASYDVLDTEDGKWEIRSITKEGIYFTPSGMVGSGRDFERKGFLNKLHQVRGFVVCDLELFPEIPYWKITAEDVGSWWESGKLGPKAKISRKRMIALLDDSKQARIDG